MQLQLVLVFIISNVLYSWFDKCPSCILETQLFRNSFKTLFYTDLFFFYVDILPQIYPEEILLQHHTGTVEIIILIGRVIWGPASKVSNLKRVLPGPSEGVVYSRVNIKFTYIPSCPLSVRPINHLSWLVSSASIAATVS